MGKISISTTGATLMFQNPHALHIQSTNYELEEIYSIDPLLYLVNDQLRNWPSAQHRFRSLNDDLEGLHARDIKGVYQAKPPSFDNYDP